MYLYVCPREVFDVFLWGWLWTLWTQKAWQWGMQSRERQWVISSGTGGSSSASGSCGYSLRTWLVALPPKTGITQGFFFISQFVIRLIFLKNDVTVVWVIWAGNITLGKSGWSVGIAGHHKECEYWLTWPSCHCKENWKMQYIYHILNPTSWPPKR